MSGIFSDSHPPINLLANFDTELQVFLENVIDDAEKVTDKPEEFKEAIRIAEGKKSEYGDKCFEIYLYREAFMFRFSPCYISAVAYNFLRLVKMNPMVLKDALWRRQVNLCCLAGGPALEVVALSKILSSAQDCFWEATKKPLHLQVTIVDQCCGWIGKARKVLKALKTSLENFDETKITISLRFVEVNSKEPLGNDVLQAIQEADVITMVKFVSKQGNVCFRKLSIKDIADLMKPKSILFYLDTRRSWSCYFHNRLLRNQQDIKCIYGPNLLEVFTLTKSSIKKNVKLFWENYHKNICLPGTIVNTCSWIKTDGCQSNQTLFGCSNNAMNSLSTKKLFRKWWFNEVLMSERKLNSFLRKLRKIVLLRRGEETEELYLPYAEYILTLETVLFCSMSKKNTRIMRKTSIEI